MNDLQLGNSLAQAHKSLMPGVTTTRAGAYPSREEAPGPEPDFC